MTLKIKSYYDIDKNIWDDFVANSNQGWFWHTSCFIDIWPYGENCSFAIVDEDKNELLTVFPLKKNEHKTKNKKLLSLIKRKKTTYILDSLGGYAAKNDLGKKLQNKIIAKFNEQIDEIMQKDNISSLTATLPALAIDYFPENSICVNPMLFWGFENNVSQTWVIDLSQDEDEIFKNFSETTRRQINKIKKENYKIRVAESTQKDLDIYYNMHCETYKRTGVPPHPKKYFEDIFFKIMPQGLNRILFLEKDNKVIAAQNTLFFKGSCVYWTGASIDEKDNGANRYLFYLQMIFAKQNGFKYYEVGEAFPHIKSGKLKGLNDFKKSFGGFLHPIFGGRYLK